MPASGGWIVSDQMRWQRTGLDQVPEEERDAYLLKRREEFAEKVRSLMAGPQAEPQAEPPLEPPSREPNRQ